MKRSVIVALGWLVATFGLYVALLALELYWNLYDWQPRADWKALGLILGTLAILTGMRFLAKAARDCFSQGVSLVACLALLILAIYVFPAEPLTQDVFARTSPSPLWYRTARFLVMALPSVFWSLELLCRIVRRQPACYPRGG